MGTRKRKLSYGARLSELIRQVHTSTNLLTGSVDMANIAAARARMRYHYIEGGTNGKGQKVWFCWSIHKDKLGYFWSWREVHTDTAIKRYQMASRRTRTGAHELAVDRQHRFIDRIEAENAEG